MNLFQSILDKASNVTGIGMSDPTQSSVYKLLSPYEQTAQNVTGAMQDTAKMYEQKAQGISQWGQNVANKPGYAKLGKMVKAKYPEYSDMSDEELGQKMLAKYPEYNDIVSGETSALGYGAKALSGIGSMAVSAPGMVAGGTEQLGTGIGTIASSQSGQDVAQGVLQAGKGALQAGFGVATGAMPIASTLFGAASGFEPVQKGFQYLGQKAGDISAGTAGLLGGNQAVQEQARGFGEVALPALALGGVSKSGKVIRPVAKATGKAIVRGAEVVAPKVVQGVKTGVQTTGEGVGKVTKSIVSQQSGLGTPAIESILKTPELQGKIRSGELSGVKTLEEARSSIDALREGYRETGKMYDTVRNAKVPVAKNEAKQVLISQLESEGLATGGKLNLVDLPVKDRGAITQALKYIDEYGDTMTPQNALSIRQKLDDLINYKSDVGSNGQRIVQGLRAKYDEFLGNKLPGLKEIDTKYAPERQFWESVRKDIYKADGTLKDNALSVISNITNKGNEARLARMEQILPGIGEKVKALKAFEDIQNASGIKVGTYGRAATTGAIALASVPLAIATWVATHPVVVARVLESIGLASQKIKSILSKGSKITPEEANIVAKAVAETPKSKVENIINNLAYDPKTNKLSSKTLTKNGNNRTNPVLVSDKGTPRKVEQKTIVKPNTIKNESKVSKPTTGDTIPEGYFKNVFGEIQKNPSNKKGGFIKIPEIGKKTPVKNPLVEEARKYKSAEEFVKAQGEPVYHGTTKVFNPDEIGLSKTGFLGEGIYTTPAQEIAKKYSNGGTVHKYILKKDAKIFDMGKKTMIGEKEIEQARNKGADAIRVSIERKTPGNYETEIVVLNKNAIISDKKLLEIYKKRNTK